MRKIKFRGKRIDNSEWIEGYYGYKDLSDEHFIIEPTFDSYGSINRPQYFTDYSVYPKSVGQYTGLIDKKGVEIYEGDIVKVIHFNRIHEVKFFAHFGFACVMPFLDDGHHWSSYSCEVIGNIYENPELLESSE
jgi:uncharacterized phage protein (TIGR01671 family)